MIDIHSHIIQGLDHGAKTVEETLELLRISEKCGVKVVFATPHYNVGEYNNTIEIVSEVVKEVNEKAKSENINVEVLPGQEIYLTRQAVKDFVNGKCGTLNNSNYALIELDYNNISREEFELLFEFKLRGITPIIAHPERYTYIINDTSIINKLVEEGCLFQLNYGSLSGKFGKEVKKTSEFLLKNKVYSFIGSDAHDLKVRNTEITSKYLKKDQLKIFYENGEKLIKNEKIEFVGKNL